MSVEKYVGVVETKKCKQAPNGIMGPERWVLNTKYPEQMVVIGNTLSYEVENNLKQLLRNNLDMFAFEPSDMTGISGTRRNIV